VVLDEGYSSSAPDLSFAGHQAETRPPGCDFPHGYNPDITLFLRQARELGLRFDTLIGQGAGYTVYSKLKETVAPTPTTSSIRSDLDLADQSEIVAG